MTDYSIRRAYGQKPWVTRDGQPLLWPEGEDRPVNGFMYERVSDIAGNLDTKENLKAYNQCKAVCGVVKEKGLAWQFRALVSEFADPWVARKDEVKGLLALAEKIGGDEEKSGIGSAIHRLCHLKDIGADIIYPVAQLEPWLDCYEEAVLSRYDILDDETFVVCDDLERPGTPEDLCAGGSYDRLMRDKETGEIVIGDIKSGKQDNEWAMKPTVQVAAYSRSKRYSQLTGVRELIHPDLNIHKGVLIHMPFHGGGPPECCVYPLNLDEGWRLAMMSADLTKARRMRVYKRDLIARAKAPK